MLNPGRGSRVNKREVRLEPVLRLRGGHHEQRFHARKEAFASTGSAYVESTGTPP